MPEGWRTGLIAASTAGVTRRARARLPPRRARASAAISPLGAVLDGDDLDRQPRRQRFIEQVRAVEQDVVLAAVPRGSA